MIILPFEEGSQIQMKSQKRKRTIQPLIHQKIDNLRTIKKLHKPNIELQCRLYEIPYDKSERASVLKNKLINHIEALQKTQLTPNQKIEINENRHEEEEDQYEEEYPSEEELEDESEDEYNFNKRQKII